MQNRKAENSMAVLISLLIDFYCTLLQWNLFKGVISAKKVKIIKFLFFAQKVSSGMGALRPKFLGG